jgi:CO dehydrogenase maturation factor
LKIAIAGKGGTGKTTLAAALSLIYAENGMNILAVDADPQENLAAALGVPPEIASKIVPIAARAELIEERTGAKPGKTGQVFKLNPEVSDVAEMLGVRHSGLTLVVLGGIENGGGGCACPENAFLRALVQDLVLFKDETLVMDMAAGFEHLGRATAQGVDFIIAVAEPGARAVECARRIKALAREIGVKRFAVVGNKVRLPGDEKFIREAFPEDDILGFIPFTPEILEADRARRSVLEGLPEGPLSAYRKIAEAILEISR